MRWANDGLRFLLGIALLTSLASWGFSEHTAALQWVLGLGALLVVAGVAALFAAERTVLALVSPPWFWFTSA
jgi:hypothetical protein